MVEGPNGTVQLESPIAGVVAARNETIIENPGLLARNAECVDDAWLVDLDVDDDPELVRAELEEAFTNVRFGGVWRGLKK